MAVDVSENDFYCDEVPDGQELCPRCDGSGGVACHCGGDLCFCENQGDRPCPLCGGEYGGEGYVSKEKAAAYFEEQTKFREVIHRVWSKV